MPQQEVREWAVSSLAVIADEPGMSEHQTRASVVDPMLRSLGWNPSDLKSVRQGHPLSIGTTTVHVDYVLRGGAGSNEVVVEAKAPREDLTAEFARQASSYALQLGAQLAVLTNGTRVQVFLPKADSPALVLELDLTGLGNDDALRERLVRLLGKDIPGGSTRSAEATKISVHSGATRWLEDQPETVIELLSDHIQKELGLNHDAETSASLRDAVKIFVYEEQPAAVTLPTPLGGALAETVAGDWELLRQGTGLFRNRRSGKQIDVGGSMRDVEAQLAKIGYKLRTTKAIGGFYFSLRREAGLIRAR